MKMLLICRTLLKGGIRGTMEAIGGNGEKGNARMHGMDDELRDFMR